MDILKIHAVVYRWKCYFKIQNMSAHLTMHPSSEHDQMMKVFFFFFTASSTLLKMMVIFKNLIFTCEPIGNSPPPSQKAINITFQFFCFSKLYALLKE